MAVLLAVALTQSRQAHAQATAEPRWIWGVEQSKDNEVYLFRKSFETFIDNPQKDVKSATLWGTCDNEMIVYLNGKKVTESTEWERSTILDVTKALIPGRNLLAVRGRNTDGPAGLILRLTINKADGTKTIGVTDGTWKVTDNAGTGWESASYDDAAWRWVHVIGSLGIQPWGNFSGADGKMTAQATPADQITTLPGFKIELLYSVPKAEQGSIIVAVATDAPFLPHQLDRLVKRASLGIGIMGGRGGNSSGDIFVAFSTANNEISKTGGIAHLEMLANEKIDPFFQAVTSATEEAIVNTMIAAETMEGINGNKVYAIPQDRLIAALKKYNRLGH